MPRWVRIVPSTLRISAIASGVAGSAESASPILWTAACGSIAHSPNRGDLRLAPIGYGRVIGRAGRPRGRFSGGSSFTPRRWSASLSRHSIWALTLLSSAAAARSSASQRDGSIRSGKALLGGGGTAGRSLLVERAGVDDGLGVAFAAQHDHQVRDHRRLALVVELDDALLGEELERVLDHRDGA